eukprot:scaffold140_cov163-Amphora_coffeaeformis.AAC.4
MQTEATAAEKSPPLLLRCRRGYTRPSRSVRWPFPAKLLMWLLLLSLLFSSQAAASEIVPSDEWQRLGPNDTVPAGLEIRMDLGGNGGTWARKIRNEQHQHQPNLPHPKRCGPSCKERQSKRRAQGFRLRGGGRNSLSTAGATSVAGDGWYARPWKKGEKKKKKRRRHSSGRGARAVKEIVSTDTLGSNTPNCFYASHTHHSSAALPCRYGRRPRRAARVFGILALLVEDDPDTRQRYTVEKACTVVSNEFMDICGPACHPKKCDYQPRYCGCKLGKEQYAAAGSFIYRPLTAGTSQKRKLVRRCHLSFLMSVGSFVTLQLATEGVIFNLELKDFYPKSCGFGTSFLQQQHWGHFFSSFSSLSILVPFSIEYTERRSVFE